MSTDVDDRVRRALHDIIDAAGELGPCPAVHDAARAHGDRHRRVRRSVLVAAGLLIVTGVGGIAWIAQRTGTTPNASTTVDLGPVDRFAPGTVTAIDDPPLFVVNDRSTGLTVFDARSTHRGCILVAETPETDGAATPVDAVLGFVDPCHGSTFDPAGNKLTGPAGRSMDTYPASITDQRLVVDLSQPILGDPATTPTYAGEDLDLTLPIVGRGWADSMEFGFTPEMNARLYDDWQAAIAECMRARGFEDDRPVAYPTNADFVDRVNPLDRRYASVMGYHELPAEPEDPNTYTDEARVAAGACADAAYEDVFGGFRDYIDINDQLRSSLSAAIDGFQESDVGREAASRWAACMAERGHRYTSRGDAMSAYVDRPTISDDEIATRLDDLDCDIAVGYTQTQHDWEQARIDAWRREQRETIDRAVELRQLAEQQLAQLDTDTDP